jgi:hypothetical protein
VLCALANEHVYWEPAPSFADSVNEFVIEASASPVCATVTLIVPAVRSTLKMTCQVALQDALRVPLVDHCGSRGTKLSPLAVASTLRA